MDKDTRLRPTPVMVPTQVHAVQSHCDTSLSVLFCFQVISNCSDQDTAISFLIENIMKLFTDQSEVSVFPVRFIFNHPSN